MCLLLNNGWSVWPHDIDLFLRKLSCVTLVFRSICNPCLQGPTGLLASMFGTSYGCSISNVPACA